jgi:hypothetical protein
LSGTYPNPGLAVGAVGPTNIAALAVGTAALADNSVTNGKMADLSVNTAELVDLAVQTAKIANDAITTGKIANGNVTSGKLAMAPSPYAFISAPASGLSWSGGLPPRIKFAAPNVVSIIGDLGGATDPHNPRVLGSADLALGYLPRVLPFEITISQDLNLAAGRPTIFHASHATTKTVTLPDSRNYPPGSEITFIHIGGGDPTNTLIISLAGAAGAPTNINGTAPDVPAVTQSVVPGQTKKFVTTGTGWYPSRESFSRQKIIPMADGVAELDAGTLTPTWGASIALGGWKSNKATKTLNFPVDLPDGAILTGVDALIQMTVVSAAAPTYIALFRDDISFTAPSQATALVGAPVSAVNNILLQVIPLAGLTEYIDKTQHYWTVSVAASDNGVGANGDVIFALRLTYTL